MYIYIIYEARSKSEILSKVIYSWNVSVYPVGLIMNNF